MSVINQMLRDLDDRVPNRETPIPLPATEYVHRLEKRSSSIWVFVVLGLLVAAAAGVWMYYPDLQSMIAGSGDHAELPNTESIAAATVTPDVEQPASEVSQATIGEPPDAVSHSDTVATDATQSRITSEASPEIKAEAVKDSYITKENARQVSALQPQDPVPNTRKNQPLLENEPAEDLKKNRPEVSETLDSAPMQDVASNTRSSTPAVKSSMQIIERANSNEIKARKRLADGTRLMLDGVDEKAIKAFKDALKLDSTLIEARERLITLLLQQNNLAEMKPWLDEGMDADPHNQIFVTAKSRQLVQQGDYPGATSLLAETIRAGKGNETMRASLAAIYQQTGDFAASAELYNQLLTNNPEQPNWWLGFAISLENLGQTDAAIESYRRSTNSGQLSAELAQYALQRMSALSVR